ncbi:hypothetical protein PBI_DEWDROP_33 [Microbacterium phage Dewdrop]|nr:hypothetical protein PBI_LEAF_33 [Microbacterium phage Leaf]QGZ17402.1 hypothetical protein PBI_DEWDROP_33 [Microbacterium phage Dewdrop]
MDEPTEVWCLFQASKIGSARNVLYDKQLQGVYRSEVTAAIDADRLGGEARGYSVERWTVDTEPVAPRETP